MSRLTFSAPSSNFFIIVPTKNGVPNLSHVQRPCLVRVSQTGHNRRPVLSREAEHLHATFKSGVGDSHIESLAFERVNAYALNAGIVGDISVGVLQRLSNYEPLQRWRYIVLVVGFNDLMHKSVGEIPKNYQNIFRSIRWGVPIYLNSLLPINQDVAGWVHKWKNESIRELKDLLRLEASKSERTHTLAFTRQFQIVLGQLHRFFTLATACIYIFLGGK